jgi:DNA repair protein RecO (recombination protein O)
VNTARAEAHSPRAAIWDNASLSRDRPMPTITDTAICIRRWDFSETSQTVSLFTRDHGVVRGIAKGAKRAKGQFSGGIDLLTRGEVIAIFKPGSDLATITAWNLTQSYGSVRTSLAANRAGLYMVDLVHHVVLDHDAHAALFDGLARALEALERAEAADIALLRFQWLLLSEAGYHPILDRDAETGQPLPEGANSLGFSVKAGGVVCDTGAADRWRARRETIDLLRAVAARAPTPAAPAVVERANRLLAAYIREVLGEEPASMRWAFASRSIAPRL